MNCPQCKQAYSYIQPAMIIPYCGDSFCLKCLTAMQHTFGGVWCLDHPIKASSSPEECFDAANESQSFLLDSSIHFKDHIMVEPPTLHMSNLSEINYEAQGDCGSRNLFDSIGSLANSNAYTATPYQLLKLEELSVNHTIMTLANAVCDDHKQDKRLFCINDGCSICEKCAIFGNHRGHQVVANESLELNMNRIKNQLKKVTHYLYGTVQNHQSSASKFLESLKSENFTRKEEISKWVVRNLTKLVHKIEKAYQQSVEQLKTQKQQQLKQINSKFSEISRLLTAAPSSRMFEIELLESDLRILESKHNPHEYLWFEKSKSVRQRFAQIKETLRDDLKYKISRHDEIVNSFTIHKACTFQGRFLNCEFSEKEEHSGKPETTQNSILYELLTGSDREEDFRSGKQDMALTTRNRKSLTKTVSLMENEIGQSKRQTKYQPGKHKVLQKHNERKTRENGMLTTHSTSYQKPKSVLKVGQNQQNSMRKSNAIQSKHSPTLEKLTSSSTLHRRGSLSSQDNKPIVDSQRISRNRSSVFDETLILNFYPDSRSLLISPLTKAIEATDIYLDNFKAIEVIKKSVLAGASLKSLDFSNNKLTNKFLEFLAEASGLRSLKAVNVKGNRIEPRLATKHLTKLLAMGISVKFD